MALSKLVPHISHLVPRKWLLPRRMGKEDVSRLNEWFVPKFGPVQFRIAIGILFLPYTAMCISFVLLGSLLSPSVHWDRIVGLSLSSTFLLWELAHTLLIILVRGRGPGEENLARTFHGLFWHRLYPSPTQ